MPASGASRQRTLKVRGSCDCSESSNWPQKVAWTLGTCGSADCHALSLCKGAGARFGKLSTQLRRSLAWAD